MRLVFGIFGSSRGLPPRHRLRLRLPSCIINLPHSLRHQTSVSGISSPMACPPKKGTLISSAALLRRHYTLFVVPRRSTLAIALPDLPSCTSRETAPRKIIKNATNLSIPLRLPAEAVCITHTPRVPEKLMPV